jgi:2-polyprenyl-6-hydroxyphenyl methylase/3-demethylubiquinone-9 3-methyltransferase
MQPTAGTTSVDEAEIARFSAMAAEWWDPKGKFKPLHTFNPARLGYFKAELCRHFGRDGDGLDALNDLAILDIGCGGGLVAEPLARLGARVTGVDAAEKNIGVARLHAEQSKLAIDYRVGTAEDLAATGAMFDAVLALEIVEHVANVPFFLAEAARMVRPGGLMIVSTLNRTAKAFALAVVGAEYVLGWLPRGTHDWKKFVTPAELEAGLTAAGLTVVDTAGVTYNPLADRWSVNHGDIDVNYMVTARRSPV